MDPLTGGSVDSEKYSPTIKPKVDEEKDSLVKENDDSDIETQTQAKELEKSKDTLKTNRPAKTNAETNANPKAISGEAASMFNLSAWTTGVVSPKKASNDGGGFRDIAKGLLVDGISNLSIESKKADADSATQEKQIRDKLEPIVNGDASLTDEEKKQSLSSIPKLISSLPSSNKSDEENIRKTMQDIFALESVPKKERQGHFLDIAKSAFNGSSLSTEEKTDALKGLIKAASPDISDVNLNSFAEITKILPNESPKQKEIFRNAINKLSDLNSDTEMSNLERTTKTLGEVLDTFSKYRDIALDDNAKQEIQSEQRNVIEGLINSSVASEDLSEKDKALMSRVVSDLVVNLDDNPATRENELKELMNFTNNATDLNLESVAELKDFAVGLYGKLNDAYAHLGKEGQVDLASKITSDVLKNLDVTKQYGFQNLNDKTIREGVEQIFNAVGSDAKFFEDPKAQANVLKGINHIVSGLDAQNKDKLVTDIAKMAFSSDGNLSSTENMLADVSSNAISKLSESQVNELIDFGVAYGLNTNKASMQDLLGSSTLLGAKLGLDSSKVANAQRMIADIGVGAFQDIANKTGTPVNIANLKAILSPGPNGVVGNDGVLDNRDSGRVAHQVADNIINNPISHEERSANAQANSRRETQHQAEVRKQANQTIPNVAAQKERQARNKLPFGGFLLNGVINRKRAKGQAQAHYSANTWYPGKPGRDETTRKMNQGYFESRGQAQAQMRQGVVNEAYGQISQALNDPSSQKSINMLSQMLNKSSLPNYTKGSMRIDDLRSLESLKNITRSLDLNSVTTPDPRNLLAGNDDVDVNKLLGMKPDLELERSTDSDEHGHFDLFKDKNTNEEFYRLIDKNNETKFAIKKEEGGYAYLDGNSMSYNGKSYKSVVEDFEKKKPFELALGSKQLEGPTGNSFDLFSDKSTGQEFYRRTEDSGQVTFALKSEDSKTGWKKIPDSENLRGRDYSSIISEFEKQNPRPKSALARNSKPQVLDKTHNLKESRKSFINSSNKIEISKREPGANGSEFISFKDKSGNDFYAIKERSGNIKLRKGTTRAGTPMSSNHTHKGINYSWMLEQLK